MEADWEARGDPDGFGEEAVETADEGGDLAPFAESPPPLPAPVPQAARATVMPAPSTAITSRYATFLIALPLTTCPGPHARIAQAGHGLCVPGLSTDTRRDGSRTTEADHGKP